MSLSPGRAVTSPQGAVPEVGAPWYNPPRGLLSSSAARCSPGIARVRPGLVIREGLGDAGACPIAGASLFTWGSDASVKVTRCFWYRCFLLCQHFLLCQPLHCAAAAAYSTCSAHFSSWSCSLPVPAIHPPGLAPTATPSVGKEPPAPHPAQHPTPPQPNRECWWQKGKILQNL